MAVKALLLAVLVAALLGVTLADDAVSFVPPPPLGHGFNFGDMLEAPTEGAWGTHVEDDYFPTIKQAGFTMIRVPIRWSAHVGPGPDFILDPVFLSRIDWVVEQAEKAGLTCILDYHNDDALMRNPDANSARFVTIWVQIAEHYKSAPTSLLFELLNEPNGKLDAGRWNALQTKTLSEVRKTNPTRTVVVGPVQWNSIAALPKLVLPETDRNLLVTIHFYDPFHFTHQGAEWAEGSNAWLGTTWGTDADRKAITNAFDAAAKWSTDHHRSIYLGEFGAYSKSPIDGRARWTACVARAAEAHGMPWTYWEFCAGFGAYDPAAKVWRKPLLEALTGSVRLEQ